MGVGLNGRYYKTKTTNEYLGHLVFQDYESTRM